MIAPIAYVSRAADDEEATWVDTLSKLMPNEKIVSIRQMTDAERQAAEIAIVANPDPADIASLPGLTWIHSLWAGVERIVSELGPTAPPIVRQGSPGSTPKEVGVGRQARLPNILRRTLW